MIHARCRNPRPGSLSFRVSRDKAGDYQCVSTTGGSSPAQRRRRTFASLPAALAIAQIGNFIPERDETVEAFVGNDVVIDCNVPDSNPPAFVQFYKASAFGWTGEEQLYFMLDNLMIRKIMDVWRFTNLNMTATTSISCSRTGR